MAELEARAVFEVDEREGVGFLSFRDEGGQLIDGTVGLDSLVQGFARAARMPSTT